METVLRQVDAPSTNYSKKSSNYKDLASPCEAYFRQWYKTLVQMASYLFRRNGCYYFRWVIPSDARHLFGGRREIRKSLKTYNRNVATTLAASLLYEMKRKTHKESVPEDVALLQPEVVRCYHPEEVCKEISFTTDDGIKVVINHDDPAEELRQAKQLVKELKGKHATPAPEDSPLISEI